MGLRTARELNNVLSSDFPLEEYETLADLLTHLGISETDSRNYMFLGRRHPGDQGGVPLLPGSSISDLHRVFVVSMHIGG